MKRFITLLLALLILSAACALAEEPADIRTEFAVSGAWFGKLNGFPVSLVLNEDGTFLFRVSGLPVADSSGSWTRDYDTVLLDGNADLPFFIEENRLYFPAMGLSLTRNEEKGYEPESVLSAEESDLALFQGAWASRWFLMDDAVIPAEAIQDDTILFVENTRAALTGDIFGSVFADFVYEGGAMTMSTQAMAIKLEIQKDFLLRMTVSSDGEDLTVILSPYRTELLTSSLEGPEAEAADPGL